ncbi:MAG: TatD family hydrolase [Anaerovoracaceae bacterium]
MIFDSHAHLDLEDFDADREAVFEQMRMSGISYVLNPGVDLESSCAAIALAEKYPWIYAAVGFHPQETYKMNDESLYELEKIAGHTKVAAIGEIGLDYYRERTERSIQQQRFREQIRLAEKLGLPIAIHDREAHGDTVAILKEEKAFDKIKVLMHCYSGSAEMARELLKSGCYFSISGSVTYGNNKKAKSVLAEIPLDHMCVETDAPFLAPEPVRSESRNEKSHKMYGSSAVRNDPSLIVHTIRKIAELKGLSFDEVAAATCETAKLFYGIK